MRKLMVQQWVTVDNIAAEEDGRAVSRGVGEGADAEPRDTEDRCVACCARR